MIAAGSDLLQLFGGNEAVFLVGNHQRATRRQWGDALPGGLQHRQLAGQWQELLRVGLARKRP